MKNTLMTVFALGLILIGTAAVAAEDTSGSFRALSAVGNQTALTPLSDEELASVEGAVVIVPVPFPGGLVDVTVTNVLNRNDVDVRVIRDVTLQNVDVAVTVGGTVIQP